MNENPNSQNKISETIHPEIAEEIEARRTIIIFLIGVLATGVLVTKEILDTKKPTFPSQEGGETLNIKETLNRRKIQERILEILTGNITGNNINSTDPPELNLNFEERLTPFLYPPPIKQKPPDNPNKGNLKQFRPHRPQNR